MRNHLTRMLVLLAVCLAALSSFGVALAQPATDTLCNNYCEATGTWNGINTHGAATTTDVSAPSYSGQNLLLKFMEFDTADTTLQIGTMSNDADCGSGNFFFYHVVGTSVNTGYVCFVMPTGDYNQLATFKASYFLTNGPGWFIWITSAMGAACKPQPNCTYTSVLDAKAGDTVTKSLYDQYLNNTGFTGHAIWGARWEDNQYFQTAWLYDGTASAITLHNNTGSDFNISTACGVISSHAPPQMCWHTLPNGSSNLGGLLYTCDYDTNGNDCTIGS